MGTSENNRKAKFYSITRAGRQLPVKLFGNTSRAAAIVIGV
jgi:hypothetical protein